MRTVLAVVCVFTAAAASWLAVMEGVLRHPGFPQRILVSAAIVAQGVLTLWFSSGASSRAGRTAALAGACGVLLLGASAVIGNITGAHFEGYAVVIGAALVVQGVLTLVLAAGSARRHLA